MKKFKVIGAKDCGSSIQYCQLEIEAEDQEQAEKSYLLMTKHEYDVLRSDEIMAS